MVMVLMKNMKYIACIMNEIAEEIKKRSTIIVNNEQSQRTNNDEGECQKCCRHFVRLSQHMPHCRERKNK